MAIKIIVVFLIYTHFSQALPESDESPGDIDYWCKTTPHPEPCNYFLGQNQQFRPKNREEFRRMLVQVALDRTLHAQSCTERLGNACRSKRRKAAWNDCDKLLHNTIFQLNRTLESLQINYSTYFDFDAQTWLSAALTNLETCRSGSVELNVTKFIAPIMSNNVSELISNCLAINGLIEKQEDYSKDNDSFPSWVSAGERKLLQTSSWASRANVVVAKDRSGKFGSIQAAINYAAKVKRGNVRFVIYVKRGVYRENIEVVNNLNKIMLVGDGLRYTIITGSRSVAAGFTTYSSATAGN